MFSIEEECWDDEDSDDGDWFGSDDEYDSTDDFCVNTSSPQTSAPRKSASTVPKKRKSTSKSSKEDEKGKNKAKLIQPTHSNLKVEMKNVTISNETKNLVMDTLRYIHGENFSFDGADIKQSKRKLSNQYWVNQGHLRVRNCYNYSIKKNFDKEKVNSLLIENLEGYGFYTNHCYGALLHSNNDLEKAMKMLLQAYFNVDFKNGSTQSSKNLVEMDDELTALQSIYDDIVEEKVKHKHWIFHLELPYLTEWYFADTIEPNKPKKINSTKPICRYFSHGTCRFGSRCKFQHINPEEETRKSSINTNDSKLKSKFDLEIRFFDECTYPEGVPLILLVPQHREFSSQVCLRITNYLLKEASSCASQGYAYCYNLIDTLRSSENILNWLNDEKQSKLNVGPQTSLFSFGDEEDNNFEEDQTEEMSTSSYQCQKPRKIVTQETHNRDNEIISVMKSKYYSQKYQIMQNQRKQLPAWGSCEKILDELKRSQVLVIVGDTGCGKTTQIPQFILDEWLLASVGIRKEKSNYEHVEIICTQPRRLSAIGVANRVADERLEKVGEVIGYQIRLESCSSSLTRLLFCTTGILLKKMETDPFLKNVTHVIVDEVHERSEESDFLLLILKDVLKVRTDLKILLMSATVNAEMFSAYFDNAPMINIPGKMYPVQELFLEDILEEIDYVIDEYSKNCRKINKTMSRQLDSLECDLALADTMSRDTFCLPRTPDEALSAKQLFFRYKDYSKKTRKTILLMDKDKVDSELIVSIMEWIVGGNHDYPREGSILVFLPGIADIVAVNDDLKEHQLLSPRTGRFIIIPLHSTISNEEQSAVFRKTPRNVRKIVLSTNIAETSITIDDCVFVIDTGKMKETRFDTNKNMSSLETMWISKANAKQRMGRAGRVMPGLCIRLYTSHRYRDIFDAHPVPEIHRVALDQVILRTRVIESFKERAISEVFNGIIEPPLSNSIETAIERLKNIGALDASQNLTALGRHLSVLPVDVKIGKLILFGAIFCCLDSVLTIAASLSNKSPFISPFSKRDEAENKKKQFAMYNSDHLTVLNAYNKWRSITSSRYSAGKRFAEENFLSWRTLEMIGDLKHQYLDLLVDIGFATLKSNLRKRYSGDKVLSLIPNELNENGNNNILLSSILCAALYPNLVKVLTPDKTYKMGISGAIQKERTADELKFKTKDDGFVFLHPSSVNHKVSDFTSPYLVFQEKMKTSKIFIHDSTMVNAVSLVLFAGNELNIELNNEMYTVSLENGWLVFSLRSLEDAKILQHMRLEFNKLLDKKIENPFLNLADYKTGKRIISTIVHVVTKTIA